MLGETLLLQPPQGCFKEIAPCQIRIPAQKIFFGLITKVLKLAFTCLYFVSELSIYENQENSCVISQILVRLQQMKDTATYISVL